MGAIARMIDSASVTLVGLALTAVVSILAIIATSRQTARTLRQAAARDILRVSLEVKQRQLNELYGPLRSLLDQNRRLASMLREGKADPDKWRLLDHITEVVGNPQDKAIVDEIMNIDRKVEDLILNKAGLVRGPRPPESFGLFLGHYKLLKLKWEGKENLGVKEYQYYPRSLNEDVDKDYEAIKSEIDKTILKYESVLAEELK